MSPIVPLIREHAKELTPQPVEIEESLPILSGIRCLAFDIYGTLFLSGAGDLETSTPLKREQILENLLREYGLVLPRTSLVTFLHELISKEHRHAKTAGIAFPEIEIREIWQNFFTTLQLPSPDLNTFAAHYEITTNPIWPVPGVRKMLAWAKEQNLTLALVSNAQFYTPLMFEAFLGKSPVELGFTEDLTFYSYQHRQAKPGAFLFEKLVSALSTQGISPHETLYLGNDIRNDIHPASELGLKTALFAGCARSLRLRRNLTLQKPDIVLKSWGALPACLKLNPSPIVTDYSPTTETTIRLA